MAHVSHRLSGSLAGALAGGGDPATSPLYVFGPFLRLIAVAGLGSVTFGASVWLAVLTVVTVSAMYRLVMRWVTDGSGGSGLNEEEFGPWAVKLNAGITIVEYTLTFLVSMAALVTFLSDRLPQLEARLLFLPLRTVVAITLSVAVAVAVNRGPRIAARAFGPATAAVLLLLWVMVFASLWQRGLRLPVLSLQAFSRPFIGLTLSGYAHILALMTGIEIFANLVAAYEGPPRQRSRKAFGSLVIVMGTTSITMLVVGPSIQALSDPLDDRVSVFTQTMDQLLPAPLAYTGTLIGIAVLLSAAAASVQGIQNLSLGLRHRHYIPAMLGQKNRFEVADLPVWGIVAVCVLCFLLFGTREQTYLALYAAGVFVLLSLTGWAAAKRLGRELKRLPSSGAVLTLAGTVLAALLTTTATVIVFGERFLEGTWIYFLLIPALYLSFGRYRRRLGPPSPIEDRLGRRIASSSLEPRRSESIYGAPGFRNILVPLDRSPTAELACALALTLGRAHGARLTLLTVVDPTQDPEASIEDASRYLSDVAEQLRTPGVRVAVDVREGEAAEQIGRAARSHPIDAVVMSTAGRTRWRRWLSANVTAEVIYQTTPPLIVVRPTESWHSTRTRFSRLLVTLDGSETSEEVLPHVQQLADRFHSQVLILCVPEGPDTESLVIKLRQRLEQIQQLLQAGGIAARVLVEGAAPAQTILRTALEEQVDLIMMVSHGRGGVARQQYVKLGSTVDRVLEETPCPVFVVSASPGSLPSQDPPTPSRPPH